MIWAAICRPPCVNGGECVRPGYCSCRNGFHGDRCQLGSYTPPTTTYYVHISALHAKYTRYSYRYTLNLLYIMTHALLSKDVDLSFVIHGSYFDFSLHIHSWLHTALCSWWLHTWLLSLWSILARGWMWWSCVPSSMCQWRNLHSTSSLCVSFGMEWIPVWISKVVNLNLIPAWSAA